MESYEEELAEIGAMLKESARQLSGVYETHGRDGLREYSDGQVLTVALAKRAELEEIALKIDKGFGQELDVLRRSRLEAQVKDLGQELYERPRGVER